MSGGDLREASGCEEKSVRSLCLWFLLLEEGAEAEGGNQSETCTGANKNVLVFYDTLFLHATNAGIKAGATPQIVFQIKPT